MTCTPSLLSLQIAALCKAPLTFTLTNTAHSLQTRGTDTDKTFNAVFSPLDGGEKKKICASAELDQVDLPGLDSEVGFNGLSH